MPNRGPVRGFRMNDQAYAALERAARERGFPSASAFMRDAVEAAVRCEKDAGLDEAEQRIVATLDRLAREIRSIKRGQQALFAFVDALVKIILTCIPEPGAEVYQPAVSRAKTRYDRFLKSVGRGMQGDSQLAMSELVGSGEDSSTTK